MKLGVTPGGGDSTGVCASCEGVSCVSDIMKANLITPIESMRSWYVCSMLSKN